MSSSIAWIVLLYLSNILNLTYSALSPIRRYDSMEYYITKKTKHFENEVIICDKNLCFIECNYKESCRGIQIFAFDNQILILLCRGDNSCQNAQINALSSQSVNIECNKNNKIDRDKNTCFNIKVFCPSYKSNQCIFSGTSCKNINLYIENWNFYDNYLNLQQCSNKRDIKNIMIQCTNKYTKSELFYNINTSSLECLGSKGDRDIIQNERFCCPFRTSPIDNGGSCTYLDIDGNCNVICDFSNELDGCSDRLIESNGDQTDLIVTCSEYWSCQNSIINCPSNANCKFRCTTHDSCKNVQVISHTDGDLDGDTLIDVYCVDVTGGGYDICSSMIIYAPSVTNVNIICSGCHNINIITPYLKDLLSIKFEPHCTKSTIYAEFANNISIESYGRFANYDNVNIFANYSNDLFIKCIGYYSLSKDRERGVIGSSNTSCNYLSIYRYNDNKKDFKKTKLKCQSFGCGNLNINSINGLNDFEIEYNGCNDCIDLKQCFKREHIEWKITCYDMLQEIIVTDIFNGYNCGKISTCCGQFNNHNNFTNIVEKCTDLSLPKALPSLQPKQEL